MFVKGQITMKKIFCASSLSKHTIHSQYYISARTVLVLVARKSMFTEYANSAHTIQILAIVTLHKWRWTVGTRQQTLFTAKIPESNTWNTTHFHHATRREKKLPVADKIRNLFCNYRLIMMTTLFCKNNETYIRQTDN